jgi:signal transduction histidine kinase
MLKIERQNALAHLARGVAHDINNALGEVIPLVQQMQADMQSGTIVRDVLAEDLHRVELSLQVTRGIFGRMLRFARGSSRNPGPSDVLSAFAAVRDVLQESLSRLEIDVRAELPDQLTAVQCGQSDLERLLFNLMSNGRDALPNGGTLTIAARMADRYVEITVSDDGIGMTSETLAQIESPFFTTKEHGTGLGLSTCRSIAAEAGGSLSIESRVGAGTRVTARLSAVREDVVSD